MSAERHDWNQEKRKNGVELIGNRRHEGGGVRAVDAERFKLGRNNAHDIDAPAGDGNQNTDW